MHIAILFNKTIPVAKYGGIQRVVWWLGKELTNRGHKVTFIVGEGSSCPFADIVTYNPNAPLNDQIPDSVDVVHSYIPIQEELKKPFLIHMESNTGEEEHHINTVFVSRNHAERHGAECFVYNGLDPDDYGKPSFKKENYIHFLGKAAWRVKNVAGAINIAKRSRTKLRVLGGNRLNIHMGFRLTLSPLIRFHGMIGGDEKNEIINKSSGLLFPIIWNEPFGIAITESMYYGCPVFSTPYGSLPELVNEETGVLSADSDVLTEAVKNRSDFDIQKIHQRVMDLFSITQMVDSFLVLYEQVMNGEQLNKTNPVKPDDPKFLPFN